ncbi:MAG: site-specific DNA-methyltransferase [Planctomycetaceae bacterium]|nr:site-specific DNA-methyltransferase [Planctomycetaceae bacterium]
MKPYITTSLGALFDIDCIDFMASLRSDSVDCIFADPPFNLGKDYRNGFLDSLHDDKYQQWCRHWILEGARILKPGGSFFIYATPELAIQFGSYLNERLAFRHWIALSMKGTYPRGRKLYPAHYALLYYTRGEPKTFNRLRLPVATCRHCGKEIKDYGGHRNKLNPAGLNLTDFWEDTSPNRHRKFKVRQGVNELKLIIPERAILMSTQPGDVVFDPFGGGGSTFQAAELHERRWIGTELYDCAHIRSRLTDSFPFSVGQDPDFDLSELLERYETHTDSPLRRGAREGVSAGIG